MIRSLCRRGLRIGVVVGAILLLVQIFLRNSAPPRTAPDATARPQRPSRPAPRPSRPAADRTAVAQPEGEAYDQPPEAASPVTPAAATATDTATAATSPEAPATAAAEPPASPGAPESPPTADAAWVDPENGACPTTHPVKVKLASGIFHVPGGLAYDRTAPDRCYRDAAAAEADGFRPSKR